MAIDFAAVGVGAVLGAWLRWGLSVWLNPLVGIAVAYFLARPDIPPQWRLFAITGFLGALTTFSTFSAEVTELLSRGDFAAGGALAATHLAGSLLLTAAGFATFRALAT